MSRPKSAGLLILYFLLSFGASNSSAQEEARKTHVPTWQQLDAGLQILSLWDTVGPKWPQVVVLRLNKTQYKELRKNPVDYINSHHVLGDKTTTHKVSGCHLAKAEKKASDTKEYLVLIKHEYETTSIITSSSHVED